LPASSRRGSSPARSICPECLRIAILYLAATGCQWPCPCQRLFRRVRRFMYLLLQMRVLCVVAHEQAAPFWSTAHCAKEGTLIPLPICRIIDSSPSGKPNESGGHAWLTWPADQRAQAVHIVTDTEGFFLAGLFWCTSPAKSSDNHGAYPPLRPGSSAGFSLKLRPPLRRPFSYRSAQSCAKSNRLDLRQVDPIRTGHPPSAPERLGTFHGPSLRPLRVPWSVYVFCLVRPAILRPSQRLRGNPFAARRKALGSWILQAFPPAPPRPAPGKNLDMPTYIFFWESQTL